MARAQNRRPSSAWSSLLFHLVSTWLRCLFLTAPIGHQRYDRVYNNGAIINQKFTAPSRRRPYTSPKMFSRSLVCFAIVLCAVWGSHAIRGGSMYARVRGCLGESQVVLCLKEEALDVVNDTLTSDQPVSLKVFYEHRVEYAAKRRLFRFTARQTFLSTSPAVFVTTKFQIRFFVSYIFLLNPPVFHF